MAIGTTDLRTFGKRDQATIFYVEAACHSHARQYGAVHRAAVAGETSVQCLWMHQILVPVNPALIVHRMHAVRTIEVER